MYVCTVHMYVHVCKYVRYICTYMYVSMYICTVRFPKYPNLSEETLYALDSWIFTEVSIYVVG